MKRSKEKSSYSLTVRIFTIVLSVLLCSAAIVYIVSGILQTAA